MLIINGNFYIDFTQATTAEQQEALVKFIIFMLFVSFVAVVFLRSAEKQNKTNHLPAQTSDKQEIRVSRSISA